MNDATRSAVVALLVVLAVGFAAATLDSTTTVDPGEPGDPGAGGGEGGFPAPPTPADTEPVELPFATELLAVLLVVGAVVALVQAVRNWRAALAIGLGLGAVIVLLLLLADGGAPVDPALPSFGSRNGTGLGGGGEGGSDGSTTTPTVPSVLVAVALGVVLLGAVAALVVSGRSGDRSPGDDDEDGGTGGATAADLGSAAGRAADRIEDSGVENEVYRAWREMTELLDVADPETTTPGEFATAAVDAGLGREDVDELTRLFEAVRYGRAPPSEERERRALAVFRRIEDRYAETDGGATERGAGAGRGSRSGEEGR